MEIVKDWRSFGGRQLVVRHESEATMTPMEFSVYLPPRAEQEAVPVVLYLSGLTCTWENATTKAGFQRAAARLGLAIVCPDTSPRGADVPDAEGSDLGQGAGFYVDATQRPWSANFRMYDYVARELPSLVSEHFAVQPERWSLMGHSMGGHGALTIGLRHPDRFASLSAFAPIVAPMQVPWGQRAFSAYFGEDRAKWAEHDACALLAEHRHRMTILIDQGQRDAFLREQLRPELFEEAARAAGQPVTVRLQPGYDHSYYFVSTFIDDHLQHHASVLVP